MIGEGRIAEARHPVEVIILRVIHPACASKRPLGDRHPDVVVEAGEVRAAAGIAHGRLCRCPHSARRAPLGVHAALAARIGHRARDVPQRLPERRRAATPEAHALRGDVLVEIGDPAFRQPQRIILDVLRGSHESPFFRVPRRENDRTLGTMTRLDRFRNRARRLQHAHGSAHIVCGARSPSIAMSAHHHDLVRKLTAANDAERVVDRLRAIRRAIVCHLDARLDRARSKVISKRQTALPSLRCLTSCEAVEKLRRIAIRDRNYGNVRDRHLTLGEPRRSGHARIARRRRVARSVEDTAALDAIPVAHRTVRIHIADYVAILLRIAVDE